MGSQKDNQNNSLLDFLKDHRLIAVIVILFLFLILLLLSNPQWVTIFLQWLAENANPILQLLVGGILGGIIAASIFNLLFGKQVWEKKFDELKITLQNEIKKYEDLSNNYNELSKKNDILLENLPKAIGGPFTKSLFKYPTNVSKELAEILSNLTDEWYQQYHKRVLVNWAEDTYKIVQINKIENAGRDKKGEGMEVWELEFLSTWNWVNDSGIAKYPLRDFMIVVSAPDEAIENLLPGKTTSIRKSQRKKFFDFIRSKNIVRSIIPHKNVIQPLSKQAIPQMLSIDGLDIGWGNDGGSKTIEFEDFEDVPSEDIPHGVYNAYKLPGKYADKPLEPRQEVTITYRGRISIPVRNGSNHCTGKLFLSFPDVIAKKYTLSLNYPKSAKLKGLGKSVKIAEDKSGIWFGYERLNPPQSLSRKDSSILPTNFAPKEGEDIVQLNISKPLTDLNYVLMYWEEAS